LGGLVRFLDDGRIEIDSNVVERTIRPIALGRKNHLFAGSDGGGEHWAVLPRHRNLQDDGVDPQAIAMCWQRSSPDIHEPPRRVVPFAYVRAAESVAA